MSGIAVVLLVGACTTASDVEAERADAPVSSETAEPLDADGTADQGGAPSSDGSAPPESTDLPPPVSAPVVPTTTDPPRPTEGPDAPPTTGIDDAPGAPGTPGTPTTTFAPSTTTAAPDPATLQRIVSLAPSHTETLFAIGGSNLLVGVDVDSRFPAAAGSLQSGFTSSQVDVEPIVALDPDLVLIGDDPTGMADRLTQAGVPVWRGPRPADPQLALDQMVELGDAIGLGEAARSVVADIRAELASLRASIAPGTTYFHEIDPSLFTYVPTSFVDLAYSELGLTSVLQPGGGGVDGGGTSVRRASTNEVIAGDPDVIGLGDAVCCGMDAARIAARTGWSGITAVQRGAIAELPDRIEDRWGFGLLEFWRRVAAAASA